MESEKEENPERKSAFGEELETSPDKAVSGRAARRTLAGGVRGWFGGER